MAHLVLVSGGEPGLRLPLDGDKIVLGRGADCNIVITGAMVLGRGADCHIVLPDAMVGRSVCSINKRHATISCQDGQHYIEDGNGQGRGSRNGTFVNDHKVPFPERVQLHDGDCIRICDFVCTFHQAPEPSFSVEHSIGHSSSQSQEAQPTERLRVILEISGLLSDTLDIDSLLLRIIDKLLELFPQADRGFIILRDEATGQLVPPVSRTRQGGDQPDAAFSKIIVQQCLESQQAIMNDPDHTFPSGLPMRSLMCAPLSAQDGQPLGVIQLDSEGPKKKFSPQDLAVLLAIASQAAMALSNARLYRDPLLRQRFVRNQELASKLSRAFMPGRSEEGPGEVTPPG